MFEYLNGIEKFTTIEIPDSSSTPIRQVH